MTKTTKIRAGKYQVTSEHGDFEICRGDEPVGYWGAWEVRSELHTYYFTTKRECSSFIAEVVSERAANQFANV